MSHLKYGILEENWNEVEEEVNLSTPRPEGRGLLEVHPEPRLSTPPSKAGLRVAERVNAIFDLVCQVKHQLLHWVLTFFSFSGFFRK
jgi:hypothetical protein